MTRRRLAALLLGVGMSAAIARPQVVALPSLDAPAAVPVLLPGHWFVADTFGDRPAVVLLHGCGAAFEARGRLARRYAASAPTLLLAGESDDWTPAQPCRELAAAAGSGLTLVAYRGAYHGFDSTAPLRVRRDVPNGVRPGQGVTVGGDAAAREASHRELLDFLRPQLND